MTQLTKLELDVLRIQYDRLGQIKYTFDKYELKSKNFDNLIEDMKDEMSKLVSEKLLLSTESKKE